MKLSIEKFAKALDLPTHTIERWIRQGRLPAQKSGGTCIFVPSTVEKWAVSRNLSFNLSSTEPHERTVEFVESDETLISAMKRGNVFHDIPGTTKESVLKFAADHISDLSEKDKENLYNKLLEREQLTSTGIGQGIAIPHPRDPLVINNKGSVIATFFLENGVDYQAVDDIPVFVLFLLLSNTVKSHLQLLSRLSFCLRDMGFVSVLKSAPKADLLFENISRFENKNY
jgi:PTS system nitrogen regulatory IIA component